jgi:hypothetical protein
MKVLEAFEISSKFFYNFLNRSLKRSASCKLNMLKDIGRKLTCTLMSDSMEYLQNLITYAEIFFRNYEMLQRPLFGEADTILLES